MVFPYYSSISLLTILATQQLSEQFANLAILFYCSKHLIGTILTHLFPQRIPKSVSKSPEVIPADDNSNWVNMLEIEQTLSPNCCGNHLSQRQMITQAVNLLRWILSGKFTRELNKESLLN